LRGVCPGYSLKRKVVNFGGQSLAGQNNFYGKSMGAGGGNLGVKLGVRGDHQHEHGIEKRSGEKAEPYWPNLKKSGTQIA